jgi:hypothetical protein
VRALNHRSRVPVERVRRTGIRSVPRAFAI